MQIYVFSIVFSSNIKNIFCEKSGGKACISADFATALYLFPRRG